MAYCYRFAGNLVACHACTKAVGGVLHWTHNKDQGIPILVLMASFLDPRPKGGVRYSKSYGIKPNVQTFTNPRSWIEEPNPINCQPIITMLIIIMPSKFYQSISLMN